MQHGDYEVTSGTLSFAAGETTKTFDVLINGDSYTENPETINLTLSNATGAKLGQQSTATITINVPATQADKIKQAETRIAELQREMETLRLVEQNALLDAALELGLTKKQLETLRLSVNEKGELVLATKEPEVFKAPEKKQDQ